MIRRKLQKKPRMQPVRRDSEASSFAFDHLELDIKSQLLLLLLWRNCSNDAVLRITQSKQPKFENIAGHIIGKRISELSMLRDKYMLLLNKSIFIQRFKQFLRILPLDLSIFV